MVMPPRKTPLATAYSGAVIGVVRGAKLPISTSTKPAMPPPMVSGMTICILG